MSVGRDAGGERVHPLAAAIRATAYPLCLVGGVVAARHALAHGQSVATVTVVAALAANVVVAGLERALPFERSWNLPRGDVLVDLAHVPLTAIAAESARAAAASTAVWSLTRVPAFSSFPAALPWPLALLLAIVVADLPVYVVHRWQHRGGYLWRIHAAHHALPRLYFLNANRNHPIDVFLGAFLSLLLLGILGAPPEVLALVAVATTIHVTFQHSNVDVRFGPLNLVLSGPEVHRYHHDRDEAVGNANYGGFTLVWDLVFASRRTPPRRPSADVGLAAGKPFPTSLWGVVTSPFRRSLYR